MKTSTAQFADLIRQGRTHEIRLIDFNHDAERKSIRSHYDRDVDAILAGNDVTEEVTNCYIGLNPVANIPTTSKGKPAQAKATDIAHIRNIAIDVDAIRTESTGNQPATEAENLAAVEFAQTIAEAIVAMGIVPVCLANSGNGALIIVRSDMNTTNRDLVAGFIHHLAKTHTSPAAKIDTCVTDLPRVVRLVGAQNCKQSDCPETETNTRPSFIVTTYEEPTTVTAAMLAKFRGVKHTCSTHTCDKPSSTTAKRLRVTLPFADIVALFQKHGCTVTNIKSATTDLEKMTAGQSFVIEGCPVRGAEHDDANTWVSLKDGWLICRCPHRKCADKSIFDLLAAIGIKPSELSTHYPADPSEKWTNLVEVFGDRITETTSNTMTLETGEVIRVSQHAATTVTTGKKTLPLTKWATKDCHEVIQAATSGLCLPHQSLGLPQRLADAAYARIVATGGIVSYGGILFEYNDGGYRAITNEKKFLTPILRDVVANDCQVMTRWGLDVKEAPIGSRDVGDVLPHFCALVPEVDSFGTDRTGQYDLTGAVNYRNGVWLPATGELLPHSPNYFVRSNIGIDFKVGVPTPNFNKFINEVLPEQVQRDLFQEFAGCVMAGDIDHQRLLMLIGMARSGKGVCVKVLKGLVGRGNYVGIDDSALNYTFGLQSVIGKLLAIVPEAKDLKAAQVSKIKAATGADDFSVPMKHVSAFDGQLCCNWIVMTNNLIELPDPSGAIMTRISLIKFGETFLGREDRTLFDKKLKPELAGIAEWARVGYLQYMAQGRLAENTCVTGLLATIKETSSPVASFIDHQCERSGRVLRKDLLEAYNAWAGVEGFDQLTPKGFVTALGSIDSNIVEDSKATKDRKGRYWVGLSLKGGN